MPDRSWLAVSADLLSSPGQLVERGRKLQISLLSGVQVDPCRVMGKDVTLFHHASDDPAGIGGQYLAQAQAWFDSMWSAVSRDQPDELADRARCQDPVPAAGLRRPGVCRLRRTACSAGRPDAPRPVRRERLSLA